MNLETFIWFMIGSVSGAGFMLLITYVKQKAEVQDGSSIEGINSEVHRDRLVTLLKMAKENGYEFLDLQKDNKMISFGKELVNKSKVRINIYYTTFTVGTCLNHPKRGKTQLFRKGCSMDVIAEIFKNPRTHTGKGYYNN